MLQITPHLVVMWRPDIGKYTGHLQEPAPADAHVIKDASCNVIPQMNEAIAGMGGPLLRAWQKDPFNKNSQYFAGYDSTICTVALTNAVGAAWVTKPGPMGKAGYTAIPLYEGVAPTNHVTSTECGDDCAFISKKMMATALVSPQHGQYVWHIHVQKCVAASLPLQSPRLLGAQLMSELSLDMLSVFAALTLSCRNMG